EIKDTLSGLVTVRRTDPDAIEDGVEQALARAERALGTDDVKGALTALSALQGGAAEAAQDWMRGAYARAQCEEALQALHNRALTALAGGGA
ncbi:MAG: hypothetical protein HQL35_16135, partial [Alphaproteobacteria bacterium]|nr:hypothetical protein [Alphaproteobacteria bacterium]